MKGCGVWVAAFAGTGIAGEIDVERHRVDAFQPPSDRLWVLENVDHRRGGVGAVALIGLDVELALVAECAVKARPVHARGRTEIVKRGGGKTTFTKQVERLAERDLGLIVARAAAALRCGGRTGLGSQRQRFTFLYHFAKKYLDRLYIMRNSIKNNLRPQCRSKTAKETSMDLYFSPLACSLATRIALYEAGAEANYLEVDPKTKVVQNDGSDFYQVNPVGLVPTLRTDDGLVLTENAAILQYVADRFPQAGISTGPGMERSRLHQWLCFIGTELHKGLFVPVLDKNAPPEVKTYILGKGLSRLDYLET